MRIVIFDGSLNPPTFVRFLAENIAGKGHRVYLAGKGDSLFIRKDKTGLSYLPVASRGRLKSLLNVTISFATLLLSNPGKLSFVLKISFRQSSLLRKLSVLTLLSRIYTVKPEIIHLQWSTHVELFKDIIGNGDFRFIVSFRGRMINVSPFIDELVATLYRKYFPLVDGFHAVSKSILKNGALFGADAKKAKVVYPAIKDELFYEQKVNTAIRRVGEPLRILSVGRHHWKKGYPISLDACARLKNRGIDFVYTIIAGGDKEEILYQINDAGLSDKVKLIDRLPHDEVIEAYRNAHLFLLPSYEEGVANVVLEAMAIGVPVISTDCGGMEEVIVNDENGWIVPVRSVDAMTDAIEHFLTLSEERIKEIVEKGRLAIRKNHLQSLQTDRMIELYENRHST